MQFKLKQTHTAILKPCIEDTGMSTHILLIVVFALELEMTS